MRQHRLLSIGTIPLGMLAASALIAFLSITGLFALPLSVAPQADMRIEPSAGQVTTGDLVMITVVVSADIPANVFAGEVLFDPAVLQVTSIDYNTSIADLWAELPWYENGEGTINFAGGSTQPGGFKSTGGLVTIHFRTIGQGVTAIKLHNARVLAHDGLGSEVALGKPLDAVFEIGKDALAQETIAAPSDRASILAVAEDPPATDLNGDGQQTIADVSIFMLHIMGSNSRYDFNQDGRVTTADLSILMSSR
jgi:hypothetical protein